MLAASIRWLLDPAGLTLHGFCLVWDPWLIWTHAVADIAIGLAYFSIPLVLLRFAQGRRDLIFRPVLWLFAAFILLCGTGHWLDLLTIWVPAYGLEAVVKAATGLVSVLTAVALWSLLPRALALPSPGQLRAANDALRDSEARSRASYTNSPVPLHTLDAHGIITAVSDRWLALLGYPRDAVLGRHIDAFQDPGSRKSPADWARLFETGEVLDAPQRFIRQDGDVLDIIASGYVERQPDGTLRVLGALIDVTARKRAEAALHESEAQLRQAQKMEAIGQLTGGVAHDFNNMLQVITGNLELIRRRMPQDRTDLQRLAANALEGSAKAAQLTAQLLSFARRQRLEPQALDPAEVLDGMRTLLDRTTGGRITLAIRPAPVLAPCLADRSQLEAALLNLVVNARDAIEGATGGHIDITVRTQQVAPGEDTVPAGDYVRIGVRDDGPGMFADVRERAFEPFFTTKPVGRGSGLGLAQIHGFAHQSGGTVTIDSVPGRGTEVAILLPRATTATVVRPAPAPPREAQAGHGECVLVVDDEALVRDALVGLLRDLRYHVLAAGDAEAALALLATEPAIAAVITDLAMPGPLDGLGLAAAIGKRHPGLPVLLSTGLLDPFAGAAAPLPRVIRKPYTREGIAAALREVLAGGDATPRRA